MNGTPFHLFFGADDRLAASENKTCCWLPPLPPLRALFSFCTNLMPRFADYHRIKRKRGADKAAPICTDGVSHWEEVDDT